MNNPEMETTALARKAPTPEQTITVQQDLGRYALNMVVSQGWWKFEGGVIS